jgi:hypothetical protein
MAKEQKAALLTAKGKQPEPEVEVPVTPGSLVVQPAQALALPEEWRKELAAAAKESSAVETPSVTNVSFKSGVLSIGGTPCPGNTTTAIIVGSAFERALYDGPFDANNPRNPICFALTPDGEDSAPHANSEHPQGGKDGKCKGCPMDEWGSAGEGRRGKACKEIRRLALIPADKLESTEDILASELAMAKVPVTSVRNWSNYVHKVSAMLNVPFWAVVSRMSVKPHIKNQFEVLFDIEDPIEDVAALQAIKLKVTHVEPFVMAPYSSAGQAEGGAKAPAKPAGPPAPTPKRKF